MLFNILNCDMSYAWQIGFQDGATPTQEGIVELHNTIFFYLIVIFVLVSWIITSVVVNFGNTKTSIVHKYANHGTAIELIWTITPALILVAIAFPSFQLLYIMDSPNILLLSGITQLMSISKIQSNCTKLVPFGIKGSSLHIRLNKHSRDITVFNNIIVSQLVGHLLGDGSLVYSRTSITPFFVFTQTIKQFKYIWSVYISLSPYCSKLPLYNRGLRKGISYPFLQVITRSYPALEPLHKLFYEPVNDYNTNGTIKYKKVIKLDLLEYLNSVSLAFWAIDDGGWTPSGFYLHTEGFMFKECCILAGILHYKFGLYTSIQKHKDNYIIRIASKSIPIF